MSKLPEITPNLLFLVLITSNHPLNCICVTSDCLQVARESVFLVCPSSLPPGLCSVSGCMCVACGLDSGPRTIHCGRTRPPSVLCFPHSSALTSARLQEGRCLNSPTAVCGLRSPPPSPLNPPLTRQSGWRTAVGALRHLRQHKPPQQCNQRDALHTTCCFEA